MDQQKESIPTCLPDTSLTETLRLLKSYHEKLGWPSDKVSHLENHRTLCLALIAEATEVLNAVPWKPWKNDVTRPGITEKISIELVDCFFFIAALAEIWDITPERFAFEFHKKLELNYYRLETGYHHGPRPEGKTKE